MSTLSFIKFGLQWCAESLTNSCLYKQDKTFKCNNKHVQIHIHSSCNTYNQGREHKLHHKCIGKEKLLHAHICTHTSTITTTTMYIYVYMLNLAHTTTCTHWHTNIYIYIYTYIKIVTGISAHTHTCICRNWLYNITLAHTNCMLTLAQMHTLTQNTYTPTITDLWPCTHMCNHTHDMFKCVIPMGRPSWLLQGTLALC